MLEDLDLFFSTYYFPWGSTPYSCSGKVSASNQVSS